MRRVCGNMSRVRRVRCREREVKLTATAMPVVRRRGWSTRAGVY